MSILKEISIQTVYQHPLSIFNAQTWCVREQYWSYLKNYNTGAYKKVIVRVNDNLSDAINTIEELSIDVIVINKYFDIAHFLDLKTIERKKATLELLHDSMLYLSERFNWEKEALISAYNQCVAANIEYKFKVRNKNFKSPTKEFIGFIECEWEVNYFKATGVICSVKDNNIIRKEVLFQIKPYEGEFIYYCNCKWESRTRFSLYSKEGDKWTISLLEVVN